MNFQDHSCISLGTTQQNKQNITGNEVILVSESPTSNNHEPAGNLCESISIADEGTIEQKEVSQLNQNVALPRASNIQVHRPFQPESCNLETPDRTSVVLSNIGSSPLKSKNPPEETKIIRDDLKKKCSACKTSDSPSFAFFNESVFCQQCVKPLTAFIKPLPPVNSADKYLLKRKLYGNGPLHILHQEPSGTSRVELPDTQPLNCGLNLPALSQNDEDVQRLMCDPSQQSILHSQLPQSQLEGNQNICEQENDNATPLKIIEHNLVHQSQSETPKLACTIEDKTDNPITAVLKSNTQVMDNTNVINKKGKENICENSEHSPQPNNIQMLENNEILGNNLFGSRRIDPAAEQPLKENIISSTSPAPNPRSLLNQERERHDSGKSDPSTEIEEDIFKEHKPVSSKVKTVRKRKPKPSQKSGSSKKSKVTTSNEINMDTPQRDQMIKLPAVRSAKPLVLKGVDSSTEPEDSNDEDYGNPRKPWRGTKSHNSNKSKKYESPTNARHDHFSINLIKPVHKIKAADSVNGYNSSPTVSRPSFHSSNSSFSSHGFQSGGRGIYVFH